MAIIFKIIITIIYSLFNLFCIDNYFILISFVIYVGIIYGFYISKKEDRLNLFLTLIFIFIFWLVIYNCVDVVSASLKLLDFNTKACPLTLGGFSVFSGYLFNSFDPSLPSEPTNPTDHTNLTNPTNPMIPLREEGACAHPNQSLHEDEPFNLISPDNLNSKIEKLMEAIRIQLERSGGKGPNNPDDFMNWILASSRVSDEESDKLLKLLKDNDLKGFYNNIPRFEKYAEDMSNFYILNDNVYLSEVYADYLSMSTQEKSNFILISHPDSVRPGAEHSEPNPETGVWMGYQPLASDSPTDAVRQEKMGASEPRIGAAGGQEGKIFYFFISISDLFNSDLKKDEINIKNKKIVPMDKIKYSDIWDFIKKYQFLWFIELDVWYYMALNINFKIPFNELTPSKFMFAKYLSAWEYSEEYDFLLKAKMWYEHYKGIKPSSLSESTLNEYKEIFIKFWIRQIASYNRPALLNEDYYNVNMYDIRNVYEELLENILFAQCKILEAYWTINTLNKFTSLSSTVGVGAVGLEIWSIEGFNTESKLIDFYNELYEQFKIEVLEKYKDVYDLRREFLVERLTPLNYEDLYQSYYYLQNKNSHINFNSKLNKENFYKTLFPK